MDEILEIGMIQGFGDAELGTPLKKSGRTTGLTTGEVLQTDLTVDVDYGGGRMQDSIQEVKARHEARLIEVPGVVSVGIGRDGAGEAVIVVGLDRE